MINYPLSFRIFMGHWPIVNILFRTQSEFILKKIFQLVISGRSNNNTCKISKY